MTRDDLYAHYRRYYVPNNATLVVVGDVETDEVLRRAERHFGRIPSGPGPAASQGREPPQLGERRVIVEREGTTAYLKFAYHAPAATEADFFPMLVLDAVLTGAKGLNLWSSFRVAPPQRKSRLYTALVERGLASSVNGALLPTADPFLYTLSFTAMQGVRSPSLEEAVLAAIEPVRDGGIDGSRGRAREAAAAGASGVRDDSVTNIAHQLGYFEPSRARVTSPRCSRASTRSPPSRLRGRAATTRGERR